MSGFLFYGILAVSGLVTSFVSGILGMAGGMMLMGILLALMPVPAAMMLHGVTQFASNGWRAFLWRQHVDWGVLGGYVLASFVAMGLFIALHLVVSKPVALIVMGLTPFVTLALPERLHLNVERRGHPFACGIICTTLSLTAGVSGPILDVFFVRSKMIRQRVVATKAMTQTFSHVQKIAYFGVIAAASERGSVEPWLAAMMVATALVGTSSSRRVLERMDDRAFRQWTRWTVMTLGVFYLASGLYQLAKG